MFRSIIAIAIGAAIGAVLRWFLSIRLNEYGSFIPFGTLVANLLGGYIIGLAIALFAGYPDWPVWCRLLIIAGFCGGLTTFSSFSAEVVTLLQQDRLLPAISMVVMHVCGSLLMTVAGMATFHFLKR